MELKIVDVVAKQSFKKNIKNHKILFNIILSISIGVLHALNPCSRALTSSSPCIFLHISPLHLKS